MHLAHLTLGDRRQDLLWIGRRFGAMLNDEPLDDERIQIIRGDYDFIAGTTFAAGEGAGATTHKTSQVM